MDLFLDASDFDMLADFTDPSDVDPSFAPMPRERANTWHGRPRDIPKDDDSAHGAPSFAADDSIDEAASASGARDHVSIHNTVRKATARRNAWGNMSYADLIAKAIESSPEKRLTLSEIYAWLVENVPFFKDKGETNSSAGWKVCSAQASWSVILTLHIRRTKNFVVSGCAGNPVVYMGHCEGLLGSGYLS